MFRVPGTRRIYEDSHKVLKFRRILEPTDNAAAYERGSKPSEATRKARLLQFYAEQGGLRTVAVSDVVEVR